MIQPLEGSFFITKPHGRPLAVVNGYLPIGDFLQHLDTEPLIAESGQLPSIEQAIETAFYDGYTLLSEGGAISHSGIMYPSSAVTYPERFNMELGPRKMITHNIKQFEELGARFDPGIISSHMKREKFTLVDSGILETLFLMRDTLYSLFPTQHGLSITPHYFFIGHEFTNYYKRLLASLGVTEPVVAVKTLARMSAYDIVERYGAQIDTEMQEKIERYFAMERERYLPRSVATVHE